MTELEATRAKLKFLEMVEGTGLKWLECVKHDGQKFNYPPLFEGKIYEYEFALGVVEGKPVWVDSEIFSPELPKSKLLAYYSWNPPKPATLMVELPIEDVKYYAMERPLSIDMIDAMIERRANSCLKALRNMK